jgi:hypothetical protein
LALYLSTELKLALDEQIPIIEKSKGKGAITSTRHIRRIVQHCFDKTYERMKEDGLEEDALDLKVATVTVRPGWAC